MTITLVLGSDGTIGGDTEETYVLTIPDSLTITQDGWNAFSGGIHAQANSEASTTFSGTLTVTAASSYNWNLVLSPDKSDSVSYILAAEEGGAENLAWTFTATEVNADGGTSKDAGIILGSHTGKTAGTYVDTITFTASVEAAATANPITWDQTFVSSIAIGNGGSTTKDGITLTASGTDAEFKNRFFYNNSSFTYTSTVGSIAKIEIYTEGDSPDEDSIVASEWGSDWSYDSTTNVFTWSGTPSATISTGTSTESSSYVTSFVFTLE